MAFLTVLSGDQEGLEIEIGEEEETSLGRALDNTLPILSSTMSSHHCVITREDNKYTLKDTRSTNGTMLNGTRIRETRLKPGDVLTIGGIDIRFDGDDVDVADIPPGLDRGPSDTVMLVSYAEPDEIPVSFASRKRKPAAWPLVAIVSAGVLAVALLVLVIYKLFFQQ
jgi:pSer/pThr/pTyr-binding forkhead associated (FHA) protein